MLKRRTQDQPLNGASEKELAAPAEFAKFEDLWEFLTVRWWREERKPRETGTITVFVEGGKVKVSLNDRDAHVSAFVSVDEGQGVLEAANRAVTSPNTDWRAKKEPGGGKR